MTVFSSTVTCLQFYYVHSLSISLFLEYLLYCILEYFSIVFYINVFEDLIRRFERKKVYISACMYIK